MPDHLKTMIRAAEAAAAVLNEASARLESLTVSSKTPSDFVSEADRDAERAVYGILTADFPDYSAHMEERGIVEGPDKDNCWIVDPLDGTTNFLRGVPFYSVSIALARKGRPIAGVVLNPPLGEIFAAAVDHPTTLNGREVKVASERPMAQRLLGTGLPYGDKPGQEQAASELVAPMKATAGVRRLGSAALDLAYVACGRFDAFWEHDLSPWDVAAGIVLVRKAGGSVTGLDGADDPLPHRSILAAPASIHSQMRRLINERTW